MQINKKKEQEYIQLIKEKKIGLNDIPTKEQTYEICFEAIRKESYDLQFVKEEFKTNELCLMAIRDDVFNMTYIENPTKEIQLEALKIDSTVISLFEEINFEVVLTALQSAKDVNDVLLELRTGEYKQSYLQCEYDELQRIFKLWVVNVFAGKCSPLNVARQLLNHRQTRYLIKKGFLKREDAVRYASEYLYLEETKKRKINDLSS